MTAAQKQAAMIADITASVLAAMTPAVADAAPAKTTRKRKAAVKAAPVASCFKVRGGSKLDETKCAYLLLDETLDIIRAQYASGARYARFVK